MNNRKQGISVWERLLAEEIGIEFKACMYFLCILSFYSIYRLINGNFEASIIHMAEMIFLTYVMGYGQLYFLGNFDEGERIQAKEILYIFLCASIYTVVSYLGRWFDRNIAVCVAFELYMMFAYICAFFIYRLKRNVDEKRLNEDLKAFQERRLEDECDRNRESD